MIKLEECPVLQLISEFYVLHTIPITQPAACDRRSQASCHVASSSSALMWLLLLLLVVVVV